MGRNRQSFTHADRNRTSYAIFHLPDPQGTLPLGVSGATFRELLTSRFNQVHDEKSCWKIFIMGSNNTGPDFQGALGETVQGWRVDYPPGESSFRMEIVMPPGLDGDIIIAAWWHA
jgi:hypothetical protein